MNHLDEDKKGLISKPHIVIEICRKRQLAQFVKYYLPEIHKWLKIRRKNSQTTAHVKS
jgi:hypothetical protein